MRISVIIPTFCRWPVLCETLRMLFDQSRPAHEIIVVDQSPTVPTATALRIRSWQTSGQLVLIQQSQPNASMARNQGASVASGDLIVFLDDDIEVSPDFLESYARVFEDSSIVGVAGQVLEGGGETVHEIDSRYSDPDVGWLFCKRNYDTAFTGNFLMAGNMAVRRDDFFAIGGMDERFMKGAFREEADFAMRWWKSGRRIHYRPDVSLFHLGGAKVAEGGARHWTRKTHWVGWHHYFGSWYFLLNHATWRSLPYLLAVDLRSAGLNKKNLRRPWMIPFHFCRWLSAFPYAVWCRIQGPRLIKTEQ